MTTATLDHASRTLSDDALRILFTEARTHAAWANRLVEDDVLHQLYDLMKWGPTSANCCPARILFLRTKPAKERLRPALDAGNVDKTMAAPVTAIIAYDEKFYEQLPKLFPVMPGMKDVFAAKADLAAVTAMRNGTLQGAYFILAARSLGLDCGPMSGFDNAKVDAEFFPPDSWRKAGRFAAGGPIKSNFLCNLGYGDATKLRPRGPRLEFDEACQLL